MADLVQVPVEGGDSFLLEVDRRTTRVGREQQPFEMAQESLQRSLDRVRTLAETVVEKLSSLPRQPDVVKVEFGVKLTGEASIIVTKTTGEAHFTISLEWKREEERSPAPDVTSG